MAAAPYVAKQPPKKEVNPLIEKRPKNFGIGKFKGVTSCVYCTVLLLLVIRGYLCYLASQGETSGPREI